MTLQRAVVVDTQNDGAVVAEITCDGAQGLAEHHVGGLPDVTSGRYQIDVSERCDDCGLWHSPEAECEVKS